MILTFQMICMWLLIKLVTKTRPRWWKINWANWNAVNRMPGIENLTAKYQTLKIYEISLQYSSLWSGWVIFISRIVGKFFIIIAFNRVRYKVTVFPRSKKIKLPFLKVTVSESYRFFQVKSYRCPKVTVFWGIKLPFIVIKLPFLVIKLPFISESYRFEFS